nr:MAG: DNA pilot protein [Microviridae sp.]
MDPGTATLAAAGISSALGLTSSGLGAAGNKKAAKIAAKQSEKNLQTQIDYNKWAMNYEYEKNLEHWNRVNQYNDPKQLVARLQSAGLSPALALGGYTGNSATTGNVNMSVPSIDASTVKSKGGGFMPKLDALAGFFNTALGMMQGVETIENMRADREQKQMQTSVLGSQYDLNVMERNLKSIDSQLKDIQRRSGEIDLQYKDKMVRTSLDSLLWNIEKLRGEVSVLPHTERLKRAEADLKSGEADYFNRTGISLDMIKNPFLMVGSLFRSLYGSVRDAFPHWFNIQK